MKNLIIAASLAAVAFHLGAHMQSKKDFYKIRVLQSEVERYTSPGIIKHAYMVSKLTHRPFITVLTGREVQP